MLYLLMLFCCFRVTPQSKFKSQNCWWQERLNREGNEVSVIYKPFPTNYWKRYSCIPPSHREAKLLVAVMQVVWSFQGPECSCLGGSRGRTQRPAPNRCSTASLDPILLPAPAALPTAPTLPSTAPALTQKPTEPFTSSLMSY